MINLEKENFKDIVSEGIHLVDFYADWCGPCKMLAPILEDLIDTISVIKVNVDKHSELANEYKIMSIPTLLYFKDGEVVLKNVGFQTKEEIIKNIKMLEK